MHLVLDKKPKNAKSYQRLIRNTNTMNTNALNSNPNNFPCGMSCGPIIYFLQDNRSSKHSTSSCWRPLTHINH